MEELPLLVMGERSSSILRQVLLISLIIFMKLNHTFLLLLDSQDVLFKFEEYQHKDDKENQTTNVERGVLEKIFFDV